MPKKHSSKKLEIDKVHSTIVYKKDQALNYTRILASCNAETYKRSTISTTETGRILKFEVKAADVTALIASTNSILRRLQIIEAAKVN